MYDIEQFVARQFDDYSYYGNPVTDIQISCPFCEERGAGYDSKHHLHIHIDDDKQVVHCFRCGYGRSWIHFVMDVTGLPYWQAVGEIYVRPKIRDGIINGINTERVIPTVIAQESHFPEDFQLLHKTNIKESHLALAARRYMKHRHFPISVYRRYGIGIAESIGYRVIIPIEQGYWQGRSIYKWLKPKYMNPKVPARNILFNAGALEMYDEVVICEGAFSAMAIGDNAIALIGKEPTDEKIERILRSNVSKFVIALEDGAFASMSKLLDVLYARGKNVVVWKYLVGDPADDNNEFVSVQYDLKAKLSLLLDK
jgi:DNA primase